jgi:hypothetical protein
VPLAPGTPAGWTDDDPSEDAMEMPERAGPPGWLDDTPDADTPRDRRPILLVLAVLPWLVVLGLVVTPLVGGATPVPAATETEETEHPRHHPDPGPDERRPDTAGPPDDAVAREDPSTPAEGEAGWWIAEHRGNWRIGLGEGTTASLATAVARAWLTGLEPRLAISGIVPDRDRTYVEHLVVEAIERPADGAAVVTLLAVVLDDDEGLRSAGVQRLAVPIVETVAGPRPAGSPWRLPAPDLTPAPLVGEPVEDPELSLAAHDALEAGGLADGGRLELTSLVRTSGWPWIAHVRVHPSRDDADLDDGSSWEAAIWLRRHLDGFALTGVPWSTGAEHERIHEESGP